MKSRVLFVLFLFNLSYCALGQADPYPVSKTFKKLDLSPGLRSEPILLSDGSELSALVNVPAADSFDLIIALHWAVMANTNLEFVNCLVLPSIADRPYLVIAPLADYQYWWTAPRDKQMVKMAKLARKHLPVKKVYVVGYSDGGTGSLHLLKNYPEEIDGIVAIAASHKESLTPEKPAVVIHGTEDDLFKFDQVNMLMTDSRSSSLNYIVAEGRSHFEACLYVDYLKSGLDWLQSQ